MAGFGRWYWQTIQGKNIKSIKVVSACAPQQPSGVWSVGEQQRDYFNTMHRNTTPKESFGKDLKTCLHQCKMAGDSIILMLDVNDDVRSQAMLNFFNDLDIRDINLERHVHSLPRAYNIERGPIDDT
jgi:hypothetical protein